MMMQYTQFFSLTHMMEQYVFKMMYTTTDGEMMRLYKRRMYKNPTIFYT